MGLRDRFPRLLRKKPSQHDEDNAGDRGDHHDHQPARQASDTEAQQEQEGMLRSGSWSRASSNTSSLRSVRSGSNESGGSVLSLLRRGRNRQRSDTAGSGDLLAVDEDSSESRSRSRSPRAADDPLWMWQPSGYNYFASEDPRGRSATISGGSSRRRRRRDKAKNADSTPAAASPAQLRIPHPALENQALVRRSPATTALAATSPSAAAADTAAGTITAEQRYRTL